MQKKSCLYFILTICLLGLHCISRAQIDTEFWFAVPYASHGHISEGTFGIPRLRISTFDQPATVTVSVPANPAGFAPITLNIPANNAQSVELANFLNVLENESVNTPLNRGMLITATQKVSVYYEYQGPNSEIYALKGHNALGTHFLIPSQKRLDNWASYSPPSRNKVELVATEDNTTITIVPSTALVGGAPAGQPITVTLNRGQTYCIAASSYAATQHIGGTTITSDKPIAVNVTDDSVSTPATSGSGSGGQDLVGDQIVPEDLAGTEYIAIDPVVSNQQYASLTVYALEDETFVGFSTGQTIPTLNRGEFYVYNITAPATRIAADKPIFVFHLTSGGNVGGGAPGEAGGTVLPHLECTGSKTVSYVRPNYSDHLLVTIIVPHDAIGNFLVNGNANILQASDFTAVPTQDYWYYCRKDLSNNVPLGTRMLVENTARKFQLGVIDYKNAMSSSIGYFSDYKPNNVLSFNNNMNTEFCEGETVHFEYESFYVDSICLHGPNGFETCEMPFLIQSITPEQGGEYYIEARDIERCTPDLHDTVTVVVHPNDFHEIQDTICLGGEYALHGFEVSSGDTQHAGTHRDTLFLQTEFGCDSVVALALRIFDPNLKISALTTSLCDLDVITLSASTNLNHFLWSTDETSQSIEVSSDGIYVVTASNDYCTLTDDITITPCAEHFTLYLPNSITPSRRDGLNDYLALPEEILEDVLFCEIHIFDRWGNQVFASTDKAFHWGGEVGNELRINQIYTYTLRLKASDNSDRFYKGSIMVL